MSALPWRVVQLFLQIRGLWSMVSGLSSPFGSAAPKPRGTQGSLRVAVTPARPFKVRGLKFLSAATTATACVWSGVATNAASMPFWSRIAVTLAR